MYQTTLKSVNGYTAVGANGERLRFIGNWYANAGDTVWTDGNIIFGHSPLKASSTMMTLPSNSGIPILLDDRRGYFSPTGTWSDYDIAQYNWIVNNQNSFAGGYDDTIIDAAFSDKGDLYLVSGGRYAEYQHISKNDRIFWKYIFRPTMENLNVWVHLWDYVFLFSMAELGLEYSIDSYSFGLKYTNLQKSLILYKNGSTIGNIDLTPFATDLKEKFSAFREILTKNNLTINETVISAVDVRILAINIEKNGDINYRIFGVIQGYFDVNYCNINISSQAAPTFDIDGLKMWLPYGISCIYNANGSVEIEHLYGGLQKTMQVFDNSIQIREEVIIHWYEIDTIHYRPLTVWKTLNGDMFTKLSAEDYIEQLTLNTAIQSLTESTILTFQFDGGSCTLDKYGLATFYDTLNKVIATDVVVDDNYFCVEINSYSADNLDIFSSHYLVGQQLIVNYKIYTPDGKIAEKTANLNDLEVDVDTDGIPLMDGYYTKDTNGALTPFYFKPILKKLSDTVYLFGTHGGKLYIKTASGIQLVGTGLHNFSLEMLNDISKAKG